MPGDPAYVGGGFEAVRDFARRDIEALLNGGVSQMIVENFGSAPFHKGTAEDPVEPHVHALMARIVADAVANGIVYVPEDRGKQGAIIGLPIFQNITLPSLGKTSRSGFLKLAEEFKLEKLGDHGFLIDGEKGNIGVPLAKYGKNFNNEDTKTYINSVIDDGELAEKAMEHESDAIEAKRDKSAVKETAKEKDEIVKANVAEPVTA